MTTSIRYKNNVGANLDASNNVISGYTPSSEIPESQSQSRHETKHV